MQRPAQVSPCSETWTLGVYVGRNETGVSLNVARHRYRTLCLPITPSPSFFGLLFLSLSFPTDCPSHSMYHFSPSSFLFNHGVFSFMASACFWPATASPASPQPLRFSSSPCLPRTLHGPQFIHLQERSSQASHCFSHIRSRQ